MFGKLLRIVGIVLMGVTAVITLLSGLGTTCVALDPVKYEMDAIAPYQWLYILYVIAGIVIGVMGIFAVVALIRRKPTAYRSTIIAFSTQGEGIACAGCRRSTITLSCCDIYGNSGGDWIDCIADQYGIDGNISLDPMFCDLEDLILTLDCRSPCAPENNPECGQIGAWPIGCGSTPVASKTWGGIKALFRD